MDALTKKRLIGWLNQDVDLAKEDGDEALEQALRDIIADVEANH